MSQQYTEIESEAPYEIEDRKPRLSWPERGIVEYKNYETRYRQGLELVLKVHLCIAASASRE
jgi:hypothetical protein